MPALLEWQRDFARAVLSVEPALVREELGITGDPGARLAIYRNNYLGNLVRALTLNFPAVQRLVGSDFFAAAAQEFISQYPPATARLDDYGQAFGQFLTHFAPAAALRYLPDVARLEWAVSRALHASEAAGLEVSGLAALDEAAMAEVRFVPQPSLTLLRLDTPADAIWRAVLDQDEAAMAAVDLSGGAVHVLIERSQGAVQVRRLTSAAWHLTQRLCAGEPLHAVLASRDELLTGDEINALLADHLAHARFIDIVVPNAEQSA
jgi:hypothetical protein